MASGSQSQEYFAQQPMSLLRVGGLRPGVAMNSTQREKEDEADLLTIRIIEASERKMRMIKELLSPEQFQSLSSDLFASITPPAHSASYRASETLRQRFKRGDHENGFDQQATSGPPFSKQVNFAGENERHEEAKQKVFSKSDTDLSENLPPLELSRSQQNVRENMAKKRQAVEFFFNGYSPPAHADTLAIELRFGSYLGANLDAEDKLIASDPSGPVSGLGYLFSLVVNLYLALMSLVRRNKCADSSESDNDNNQSASFQDSTEQHKREFQARHRKFNCGPYNSTRNMATFIGRISRDQQSHKLLGQACPVITERQERATARNASLEKRLILIKLDTDSSFRLASDLNRRVLALERNRPVPCAADLATESRFLIHHPLVARMTRGQNKQHLSSSSNNNNNKTSRERLSGFNTVSLRLESLKLVSHRWDLQEEILARKLSDEFTREYLGQLVRPLEKVVRGINDLATRIGESTWDRRQLSHKLMERMFTLVEMRAKLLARVANKQRKLSMIWNELRAARDEQGFNSTTLLLDLSSYTDDDAHKPTALGSLDGERLTRSLDCLRELSSSFNSQEATATGGNQEVVAAKHLRRWQKFVAAETAATNKHLLLRVQLLLEGLPRTGDQDCPSEELKRRRQLDKWLGSLGLNLTLNEDFYFNLPTSREEGTKISTDDLTRRHVDLAKRTGGPIELRLSQNADELKLKIVLVKQSDFSFLPGRLARQLASKRIYEATFLVPVPEMEHPERNYELELTLSPQSTGGGGDTGEDGGEPTRISLIVCLHLKSSLQVRCNPRLNGTLIDFLYSIVFDDKMRRRNAFEDTQTKASKLLNRVNSRVLLALLGKLDSGNLGAKFCQLDPHFASFEAGSRQLTGFLPNVGPVSLRHALLVWRWVAGAKESQTPIYLSDRENSHTLTGGGAGAAQLLVELKSRIKSKSEPIKDSQEGFKSIELIRSLALDYIRRCELLIDQIIQLHGTNAAPGEEDQPSGKASDLRRPRRTCDLLIEPQFKLITRPKFPTAAQVVRALIPRPTARRPLMPNRRRNLWAGQSKLSQLVELSKVQRLRPLAQAGEDLEGQAVDLWRGFAQNRKLSIARQAGTLRLVVTIQQASNVPFRLVSQLAGVYPRGYSAMGTSSPLFSASPMVGVGVVSPRPLSAIQANAQHQQQQYRQNLLEPATTYVEAIFQRQQLATSLAQGKNPAWNETLFFEVDLGAATSGTQQLADEFLHLNLYDCSAHLENVAFQEQHQQQQQQQQMVMPIAQHQRIERHLLGSLQVPMSVLLTSSGRAQGSFALSQPLLLEHAYQFDFSETTLAGARSTEVSQQPPPSTNLSLFITLDPPISLPTSLHLPMGSHERADLFEYARHWERVMLAQVSSRGQPATSGRRRSVGRATTAGAEGTPHISALVLRDDARYWLACRFLAPLKPPESLTQELLDDNVNRDHAIMCRLARFTALLDPLKHGHFQVRLLASSLWFDSRQLLHEALGGAEEKAILLCNFFLHLGKCAGLLLADCIPDGRCVFVLVWSSSDQDRARTTSQLELNVSELIESLGGGTPGAAHAQKHEQQQQQQPAPVDATDFIERLPILINSRACQIWDPKTGVCHRVTSGSARTRPLYGMSVGSIVTPENVYANLQLQGTASSGSGSPSGSDRLNFDIRQRNLWFPLFSAQALPINETCAVDANAEATVRRECRRVLHTHNWRKQLTMLDKLSKMIGRPVFGAGARDLPCLDYSTFTRDQCHELRDHIERQLKSNLLIWRPTRPTYFNRTISRMIADRLASFEGSILSPSERKQNQDQDEFGNLANNDQHSNWWHSQLAELIKTEILEVPTLTAGAAGGGVTRRVVSWPLNAAYSSTRVLLDGLYASGVHNADLVFGEQQQLATIEYDQNVTWSPPKLATQFVVACHVEPYPAHTMSVWLYVGAIVETREKAS